MVAQVKEHILSSEATQVIGLINEGKSFLLSGGAGSGKTYSLVEVIEHLISEKPLLRVACITYTNAAVREIDERVGHDNLYVSTIHEFLWSNIKNYKREIKGVLLDLINDVEESRFKVVDSDGAPEFVADFPADIQYKEYLKLREGIISHDELLVVATRMFSLYPKLCRIVSDCYRVILVDEYQDTSSDVVKILLEFMPLVKRPNVVGFFGDAMQAIYEDGIGDLDAYKGEGLGKVVEVKKEQNRRNPKLVIDLANSLRTDGLVQVPSPDPNAPNMDAESVVKQGRVKFYHSLSEDFSVVKTKLGWDFSSKETKELNLTHNLIAAKAGFPQLMRIYDADKILEFAKRLKKHIKTKEPGFDIEGKTFGEVAEELLHGKAGRERNAVLPTAGQQEYIDAHPNVYKDSLGILFAEISSLYIDKDFLLDDKKTDQEDLGRVGSSRDDLIKHLFKIQRVISFYLSGDYNNFLRITESKVRSHQDKIRLRAAVEDLAITDGKTVHEIIELASASELVKVDDKLTQFKLKRSYVYDQVAKIPFSEFQELFRYLEGFTSFSTQHKTKGREFSRVLVVLNNGRWNSYNFEQLFTGNGSDTVIDRTRKILYVCCTRAKDELALYYQSPSPDVLDKVRTMVGSENVIDLDI